MRWFRLSNLLLVSLTLLGTIPLFGYGVLSHEQLIDIAWDTDIKPALLKRFPNATDADVKNAHAYAYGGSVIQDIGYYPFGNHSLTNYLHYVLSGEFVANMLREAHDLNEYAFALGALSHYAADSWGHPAVNAGVPIEYPRLRQKFGSVVTYEENPEAHLKTEFSFDVEQVAKQRYISKQYHDFIGFQVSAELLQRAFQDTYGLPGDTLLKVDDAAIGTYRFAVARVIPEMTQVALASRKDGLAGEKNDKARQEFLYHLSRADYERDFGSTYRKPGVFARILAFLLKLIPKFGPFKTLGYKDPTPQTEDLYFKSMDNVVAQYHRLVRQVESGNLNIPNRNLDTGDLTRAGQYNLADESYDDLVRRLAKDNFKHLTPEVKSGILDYFASGSARDRLGRHKWNETQKALTQLKAAATPIPPPTSPPQ